MVVGEGDYGDGEGVGLAVDDGEAHSVDAYGAFLDGEVAFAGELGRDVVFEGVVPAAVGLLDVLADGSAVDVVMDDVSVEPSVHYHASLDVDGVGLV